MKLSFFVLALSISAGVSAQSHRCLSGGLALLPPKKPINFDVGNPYSFGGWCKKMMGQVCSDPNDPKKTIPCNGTPKQILKNVKSASRFVGLRPSNDGDNGALMLLVGMAGEGMNTADYNLSGGGTPPPDGSVKQQNAVLEKNGYKQDPAKGWGVKFTYQDGDVEKEDFAPLGAPAQGDARAMVYADSWDGTGADNFYREKDRLIRSGLFPKGAFSESVIPVSGFTTYDKIGKEPLPDLMYSPDECNEVKAVPRYMSSHVDGQRVDPESIKADYKFNSRFSASMSTDDHGALQKKNTNQCVTNAGTAAIGQYCQGLNKDGKGLDCGRTFFTTATSTAYATAALWKDSQDRFLSMTKLMRERYPNFKRELTDKEIVFWTKVYYNGGQGTQASADIMFEEYAMAGLLNSEDYLWMAPSSKQSAALCGTKAMVPLDEVWINARKTMDTYIVLSERMKSDTNGTSCLNDKTVFPESDGNNFIHERVPAQIKQFKVINQ
jgi:hypothetical protein